MYINHNINKITLLLLLIILPIISGFSQNYSGDESEIKNILSNIDNFSKAVMASDYNAIASAYTSDGKLFPNNLEIISGFEDIVEYWTLPEGVSTIHHKITPEEIKILGNEAYDYGYYEGKTKRADGSVSSWRGKYVIVWKKVDGDWKMYLDIWNRIRD